MLRKIVKEANFNLNSARQIAIFAMDSEYKLNSINLQPNV